MKYRRTWIVGGELGVGPRRAHGPGRGQHATSDNSPSVTRRAQPPRHAVGSERTCAARQRDRSLIVQQPPLAH